MLYRSKHISLLAVGMFLTATVGLSNNFETRETGDDFTYEVSSKPVYVSSVLPFDFILPLAEKVKTSPTTTTTTVPSIPDGLHCPEYYNLAKEIGWPEDQLERLDYVMWRESRCLTDAHNTYDPASGSRGIIQINGFWCRPNRYSQNGYLQDNNIIDKCDDLFDPETNLKAGLAIYNYGLEKHGCGWGPWSTRKSSWCRK